MSQFLKYSEVSDKIQKRMGSQAPAENVIVSQVLIVMDELNTEYDLETTKRKESVSVIADGTTPYLLSTLITDDDVKKVKTVKYPLASSSGEAEFAFVDQDIFNLHLSDGRDVNEFTTYFEDGDFYININSSDSLTTAVSMEIIYYSSNNVVDSAGVFKNDIDSVEDDELLVPKRYAPLISSGAMRELWRISLADDGEVESAKSGNFFKSQLKKLGLDSVGHDLKKEQKRLKIRIPY